MQYLYRDDPQRKFENLDMRCVDEKLSMDLDVSVTPLCITISFDGLWHHV